MAKLLLRYDDLDPVARAGLRRHAASCPECGPRWELFRAADAWLAGAGEGGDRCPDAEELYDYAGGPGHRSLPTERRVELELHLARCESCEDLAATLRIPPPAHLLPSLPPEQAEPVEAPEPPPRRARRPRLLPRLPELPLWLPVAAAAALLVTLQLASTDRGPGSEVAAGTEEGVGSLPRGGYPELPVLRGDDGQTLLFPRGKLLASASVLLDPAPLLFELEPVPEAERYRVRLFTHDGGAFEPGRPVGEFTSESPVIDPGLRALDPGHYTFEAWATVRGLEKPLGERDFQVTDDRELLAPWTDLDDLDEPERSVRRVALLHEQGFLGAARALARTLPASRERDAYLAAWPGP